MQPDLNVEAFVAWMVRIGGYDRAGVIGAFGLAAPAGGPGYDAEGLASGSE